MPRPKLEEPVAPAGNRKGTDRLFLPYGQYADNSRLYSRHGKERYGGTRNRGYLYRYYDTLLAQIRQEVADEYCPPFATRSENMLDTDKRYVPTLFDFSGTCGMNLLDLLRKEEDVEIKWQKILNELYSKLN